MTGTIAEVFAAVDISTLAVSVVTLIVGFIGVDLLFVANRQRKKAGIR